MMQTTKWMDGWMKAGCSKGALQNNAAIIVEEVLRVLKEKKRKQCMYSTNKFVIMRLLKQTVVALMKFNICSINTNTRIGDAYEHLTTHTHTRGEGGWLVT